VVSTPRVMQTGQLETIDSNVTWRAEQRSEQRPAVVIADRGDRASLLVVKMAPAIGSRFLHLGLIWEVTRLREASRAFVAEPVPSSH